MTAPLREQAKVLSRSTLNGAIDNSTTTVVVTSASSFPTTGNFRILIEDEIMLVTAVSSNTFTVVRGQEGTSAASHSDAIQVDHIVTRDSLARFGADNWTMWGYSPVINRLVADNGTTLLTASDFTWVNQETATATDQAGTILLRCPPPGDTDLRILARSYSAPSTYIAAFQWMSPPFDSNDEAQHFGMGFRESGTGKFIVMMYVSQAHNVVPEGAHMLQVRQWSGPDNTATFTTIRGELAICSLTPVIWMKIEDDNTNLKYYIGMDGVNWILIHTVDRDTYMNSGGPNQVLWYGQNSGSNNDGLFRLIHWSKE